MYERGFHSEAVTLAAKLQVAKATVAVVKRLRTQLLTRDHAGTCPLALAKHVRAARPDPIGDAVGEALHDPRLAVPATTFALGLLDRAGADLPPGVTAVVLGFRWIWALGVTATESRGGGGLPSTASNHRIARRQHQRRQRFHTAQFRRAFGVAGTVEGEGGG